MSVKLSIRRRSFPAAVALIALFTGACALEDSAETDDGNLGNAIELCAAGTATNVETSYEEIAEMLARVSVGAGFETEEDVRPAGAVLDPTNSDEDAQDYVDQPGEIACVTEDGRLTFNVGGIILHEAQKLMSGDTASTPTTSEESGPPTTSFRPPTTAPETTATTSPPQGP